MPYNILEKPICYSTFQTKSEIAGSLLRCSRCRCAWYKSAEEQRANWSVHKKVCKRPDYEMVSKLTASQCMQVLKQGPFIHRECDHNTAAIFERLFDLMRNASDDGSDAVNRTNMNNANLGETLHAITRLQWQGYNMKQQDYLESGYRRAWACPGMPQLLHFTDLRTSALRRLMKSFPDGRPTFDDENEEFEFDMEYDNHSDESGEHVALFIVGFLVRSCIWGSIAMVNTHDGRGNLRDTNYAAAAKRRLAQIFSSKLLRDCAKKALYPIPGFILNVAENKPKEFLQLLNMGVGPAVIEWADLDYGKKTLRIMSKLDMKSLSDDAKLNMMEVCCNVLEKHASSPWYSGDSADTEGLTKLCVTIAVNLTSTCSDLIDLLGKGVRRRSEMVKWVDDKRGRRRMVIAFLHEKVVSGSDVGEANIINKMLEEWGGMEMWEKTKYAKQVMGERNFNDYNKKAEDLREYCLTLKI